MEPIIRVVVVEDDPLLRADLSATLARGGCQVLTACGTASELTAAVRDHAPDVVVFDVHLSGGDGISAFRAATRTHQCGGIAVTGDRSTATQMRAIESEVLAYVLKPVEPVRLLADVRIACARNRELIKLRAENDALSAAVTDPAGAVSRAKAKLSLKPSYLNEAGALVRLRLIAQEYGVSVPRAAEMALNNEFHIGTFCNRRRAGSEKSE